MSLAPVDVQEEDAADLQFPKGNFYFNYCLLLMKILTKYRIQTQKRLS